MTIKCRANKWLGTFSRLATMRQLTAFLLAALVAAGLSSCGGEDAQLLPGETAREITANLDTVRALADEGDCEGAEAATEQVGAQIEALSVDAELKQALREGASRLDEVIATCAPEIEETVEALPEPPEETSGKVKKEKHGKPGDESDAAGDEEQAPPTTEEESTGEPSLPPQANGKAKGHEKGSSGEVESGEAASGGISPDSSTEGAG
jgi:hypothetical protein